MLEAFDINSSSLQQLLHRQRKAGLLHGKGTDNLRPLLADELLIQYISESHTLLEAALKRKAQGMPEPLSWTLSACKAPTYGEIGLHLPKDA